MVPGDTDRAAHEAQLRVYRRMGPEARVALSVHMSEDARRIALSGIRSRHPDYDDERARRTLFGLVLGEDVVRAVWPGEAPIALATVADGALDDVTLLAPHRATT